MLLLAVATATLFSASLLIIEQVTAQGEGFAPPQPHDAPFVSKQQSGEQSAPRGQTSTLPDSRLADLVPALTVCTAWSLPTIDMPPRDVAVSAYARGPPGLIA